MNQEEMDKEMKRMTGFTEKQWKTVHWTFMGGIVTGILIIIGIVIYKLILYN